MDGQVQSGQLGGRSRCIIRHRLRRSWRSQRHQSRRQRLQRSFLVLRGLRADLSAHREAYRSTFADGRLVQTTDEGLSTKTLLKASPLLFFSSFFLFHLFFFLFGDDDGQTSRQRPWHGPHKTRLDDQWNRSNWTRITLPITFSISLFDCESLLSSTKKKKKLTPSNRMVEVLLLLLL